MADIPLFYVPQSLTAGAVAALPEETARHIGQVLRMMVGERILLTDGLGATADCVIATGGKKHVTVAVESVDYIPQLAPRLHLGVAFTKNASRNEWLLEKAVELGVSRITPLVTGRSIRERIRVDRWKAILVSAMLQSKQCWLPRLDAPATLEGLLQSPSSQIFIAHCMDDEKREPIVSALKKEEDVLLLIGPEGDFTPAEVSLAEELGATGISLGNNRLRTETAALTALTHFYLINHAE